MNRYNFLIERIRENIRKLRSQGVLCVEENHIDNLLVSGISSSHIKSKLEEYELVFRQIEELREQGIKEEDIYIVGIPGSNTEEKWGEIRGSSLYNDDGSKVFGPKEI